MTGTSIDMTPLRSGRGGAVYAVFGRLDPAARNLDELLAAGATLRRIPADLLAALDTGSTALRAEALAAVRRLAPGSDTGSEPGSGDDRLAPAPARQAEQSPHSRVFHGALSLDDWWTTALEALNSDFPHAAARRLVTDKAALYRRLARHDIPVPRFVSGQFDEHLVLEALARVGPDLVLKPTTGDASRGVYRYRPDLNVRDNVDLYRAFLQLGHIDSAVEILATEYIGDDAQADDAEAPGADGAGTRGGTAIEVSAEVVLAAGAVRLLIVHEKYTATRRHPFLDQVMLSPPVTPQILSTDEELASTVDQVAAALPVEDAVLHIEMRLHRGRWHVLDIGVRPGAGLIPHSVIARTGVDLRLLQLYLGIGQPLPALAFANAQSEQSDGLRGTCIACCYLADEPPLDGVGARGLADQAQLARQLEASPDCVGWHLNCADTTDAVYKPDAGLSVGFSAEGPLQALERLRQTIDQHGFATT